MESNQETIKPFLRWAGSKRQILPIFKSFWASNNFEFNRYIEPFAGSACLFFFLNPQKAILGDINKELINTYEQIKNNSKRVNLHLSKMPVSKSDYYYYREINIEKLSSSIRAARFIYLNRLCFNGLYRTNKKGKFNVPYGGGTKTGKIPNYDSLQRCSNALKKCTLYSGDFEKLLNKCKKDDFIYLDPPYSIKSQKVFSQYDATVFGLSDLQRLKKCINYLSDIGAKYLISYADCPEADILKHNHKYLTVEVKRNIAGFATKRKSMKEVLVSNIGLR